MQLKNKVAIVTGASSGIGRGIALEYGRNGACVTINYRSNQDEAEKLAKEICDAGGKAELFQGDISDEATAKEMIEHTWKVFGRLDILVNNAGMTKDGLLIRLSVEDWDAVMANNLRAPFVCSKWAIKRMMRQGSGRIINITSMGGIVGNPGQANYVSSKAGLIGLTKTIAKEYSTKGITCNAIAPGVVRTKMMNALPEETIQEMVQWSLLKRPGNIQEIANTALFLASDQSSYINGQVIEVDGGRVY